MSIAPEQLTGSGIEPHEIPGILGQQTAEELARSDGHANPEQAAGYARMLREHLARFGSISELEAFATETLGIDGGELAYMKSLIERAAGNGAGEDLGETLGIIATWQTAPELHDTYAFEDETELADDDADEINRPRHSGKPSRLGDLPIHLVPPPQEGQDWRRSALCSLADPYIFDVGTDDAREICQACEVQEDCRQAAVSNNEMHGMWGGQTPDERK